jgi:hypothetical protein
MSKTTFSGPVKSTAGFLLPVTTTAALPTASVANTGLLYVVTDNGVGNNETAVVLCNGTGWTLTTGAALT